MNTKRTLLAFFMALLCVLICIPLAAAEEEAAEILLMGPVYGSPGGENLIADPSFEEMGDEWKGNLVKNADSQQIMEITDAVSYTGERCLQYKEAGASWTYNPKDLPVEPYQYYRLSYMTQGDRLSKHTFLEVLSSHDGQLTSLCSLYRKAAAGWERQAVLIYTGSANAIRLNFASGGGTVYYDDMYLGRVDPFEELSAITNFVSEATEREGRYTKESVATCKAVLSQAEAILAEPTDSVDIHTAMAQVAALQKAYDDMESTRKRGYIYRDLTYRNQVARDGANILEDEHCTSPAFWQTDATGYGEAVEIATGIGYGDDSCLVAQGEGVYTKWFDVRSHTPYQLTFVGRAETDRLADISIEILDEDGIPLSYNAEGQANFFDVISVTAQDGNWHRRTVAFHTGDAERMAIRILCVKGTVQLDDIQIYPASMEATLPEEEIPSLWTGDGDGMICEESDSLIPSLASEAGTALLSKGYGFGSFVTLERNMLSYRGTGAGKYYYHVPLAVEPGKSYVLSYYARGTEDGQIRFGLTDDTFTKTAVGRMHTIKTAGDWTLYGHTFTAGSAGRVFFSIYNDTGAAEFAKLRLFEVSKGIPATDNDRPDAQTLTADTTPTDGEEISLPAPSEETNGEKSEKPEEKRSLVLPTVVSVLLASLAAGAYLLIAHKKKP